MPTICSCLATWRPPLDQGPRRRPFRPNRNQVSARPTNAPTASGHPATRATPLGMPAITMRDTRPWRATPRLGANSSRPRTSTSTPSTISASCVSIGVGSSPLIGAQWRPHLVDGIERVEGRSCAAYRSSGGLRRGGQFSAPIKVSGASPISHSSVITATRLVPCAGQNVEGDPQSGVGPASFAIS